MKFEVKLVTPEYAEALLGTMKINRGISQPNIRKFANAMARGKWQLNGQPIIVSKTGRLLDGQHRLMAVVEYGKPVLMVICEGAEEDTFETIDTGKARTAGDIAGMAGYNYPNLQAAAAALLWKLWFNFSVNEPCPPDIVQRVLERYKSINKWAAFAGNAPRILPRVPLLVALVYLDEIAGMPKVAEGFFIRMTKGTELEDGHPVLALRSRMVNLKGSGGIMSTGNCWAPFARTLTAIETGEAVYKLIVGANDGKPLKRPDNWAEHVAKLPKSLSLDDLWIQRSVMVERGSNARIKAKARIEEYKARYAAAQGAVA